MPSRARIVFPGYPHHIVQRSNRKHDAFLDAEDRRAFIGRLRADTRSRIGIWAYVLMSNHIHLIAVPRHHDSIAVAISHALERYERHFQEKYGYRERLWTPRMYVSVLDRQAFLWRAVRYVERNPLRAGLVRRAEDFPWSSAAHHCGLRADDPLIASDSPLKGAVRGWSDWLAEPDPWPRTDCRNMRQRLRSAAHD